MSGGSFDYLYEKDVCDLLGHVMMQQLESMADTLAMEGFDLESAFTREILHTCRLFHSKVDFNIEKLRGVWEAMEKKCSCDVGIEEVINASKKFRSLKP